MTISKAPRMNRTKKKKNNETHFYNCTIATLIERKFGFTVVHSIFCTNFFFFSQTHRVFRARSYFFCFVLLFRIETVFPDAQTLSLSLTFWYNDEIYSTHLQYHAHNFRVCLFILWFFPPLNVATMTKMSRYEMVEVFTIYLDKNKEIRKK